MDKIKIARKHFSKLGLMYFCGTLVVYAVQFAVYGALFLMGSPLLQSLNFTFLLMLPMYVIGIPIMVLLIMHVPKIELPKKKMGAGRLTVAAIMGWAIMYTSNFAVTLIMMFVRLAMGKNYVNPLEEAIGGANLGLIFLFTVVLAPFIEELVFRKLLIDRAVVYGEGVAILLSGLMFGLFHGNLTQFVYAFALGCFFAFIYVKTGNIKYTIILHMIMNFIGGVAGSVILDLVDYDKMFGNPDAIKNMLPQMLILFAYFFCIIGLVIAGVVLLIVKRKKFKLQRYTTDLPKGKRFGPVIGNVGMILYIVFWVGMMAAQLFLM